MFKAGCLGPAQGQIEYFVRYFPKKVSTVIKRFTNLTKGVLNKNLEGKDN
jgi:hypothetical protein